MGTTDKNLDYPEPTGYARDGASAIRALAEDVNGALGGALFRATVAAEAVANTTNDRLDLTLTVDDSPVFSNPDGNLVTYTGPDAVVLLSAQVTWDGNAAGTRKITFILNGGDQASSRVTPDSQPITQSLTWPLVLTSGDKIGLEVYQTSGGSLNVTGAKFRAVVLGVAP